jgi:hypothetical protein
MSTKTQKQKSIKQETEILKFNILYKEIENLKLRIAYLEKQVPLGSLPYYPMYPQQVFPNQYPITSFPQIIC